VRQEFEMETENDVIPRIASAFVNHDLGFPPLRVARSVGLGGIPRRKV